MRRHVSGFVCAAEPNGVVIDKDLGIKLANIPPAAAAPLVTRLYTCLGDGYTSFYFECHTTERYGYL